MNSQLPVFRDDAVSIRLKYVFSTIIYLLIFFSFTGTAYPGTFYAVDPDIQITYYLSSLNYSATQPDNIVYPELSPPLSDRLFLPESSSDVDLSVSITGIPNPAELDDNFKYEVFLINYGPGNAYDISFTAEIPGEMEYLWAASAKFGECLRTDNTVTCTLDSLIAGDSDTITITMRLITDGQFTASANVTSIDEDLNPGNNQSTCYNKVYSKIPVNIGPGGSPSFAVDNGGTVHFCYLSEGNQGKIIYATLSEGNINKEIIDNDENNFSPAITIDKKGIVHIAYGTGEFLDMKQIIYAKKHIKTTVFISAT
jgi:hypothetical protein